MDTTHLPMKPLESDADCRTIRQLDTDRRVNMMPKPKLIGCDTKHTLLVYILNLCFFQYFFFQKNILESDAKQTKA